MWYYGTRDFRSPRLAMATVWGLTQSALGGLLLLYHPGVLKIFGSDAISESSHVVTLLDLTVATPFLAMKDVGTYSFSHHSPSVPVRGWTESTDPSKLDGPTYPHDSPIPLWSRSADVQVDFIYLNSLSQSGPNQESDEGLRLQNESFQPPVRALNLLGHTYLT